MFRSCPIGIEKKKRKTLLLPLFSLSLSPTAYLPKDGAGAVAHQLPRSSCVAREKEEGEKRERRRRGQKGNKERAFQSIVRGRSPSLFFSRLELGEFESSFFESSRRRRSQSLLSDSLSTSRQRRSSRALSLSGKRQRVDSTECRGIGGASNQPRPRRLQSKRENTSTSSSSLLLHKKTPIWARNPSKPARPAPRGSPTWSAAPWATVRGASAWEKIRCPTSTTAA